MMQSSSSANLDNSRLSSSRLIRYLTDLSVSDVSVSHKQFAERLSSLIDFSDSIILSAAHWDMPNMAFEPTSESTRNLTEEFLKMRQGLVEKIIKSTTPYANDARIRLPAPAPGEPLDTVLGYEAYHRFYAIQQRDMELKIQRLRAQVRDEMSTISPPLAQLAILDNALNDTLLGHTRRFLGVVPRLLHKRFQQLLSDHQANHLEDDDPETWLSSGGWLARFYKDIQGLLLAELDVRTQPVLGLIEALNKEVDTQP